MGLVGRVKIWGASTPRAEFYYAEKSILGWVNMRAYNFFVSGPKFTNYFRPIGDEM